jgi:hypothetical protein
MVIFSNENIISLIFKSILIPQNISLKILNQMLQKIILNSIDIEEIYKRLGKSTTVLTQNINTSDQQMLYMAGISQHSQPRVALLSNHNLIAITGKFFNIFDTRTYKCLQTFEEAENISSVISLPNGIIALCLPDRINFRDSKEDYKCIKTIGPIQGWTNFQRLFVLSNNDLACTLNPLTKSIVIYDAKSDYKSFKLLTDPCESLNSIISLNDNKCATLTYNGIRIYDYKDTPICLKGFGFHNIKSLLYLPKSNFLLASYNKGIQVLKLLIIKIRLIL